MEIPNFHEEKNENRFQKHQNIIVPNTQDDPNQIESDQNKSKRDIFFFSTDKVRRKRIKGTVHYSP